MSNKSKLRGGRPSKYPPEFRRDVVAMVLDDNQSIAEVARGAGVAQSVLRPPIEPTQYTSNDYIDCCHKHQLRPSVGKVGVCWDNAVAESFWESLKRECLQGHVFATLSEARRAIFKWINWCNMSRLHSSLDDIPPTEWEQQYRQAS